MLAQIGLTPDAVSPPDIDETPLAGEIPRQYCRRITTQKAQAIAATPGDVVLTADTTVAVGRRILGKPDNASEAEAFLRLLSGRRHKVITAIAVKTATALQVKDVVTTVKMKSLSASEVADYIATDDWRGKAGAYAIQGPAGAFIPWIQGSYTGVMGLPVSETASLLNAAGISAVKVVS